MDNSNQLNVTIYRDIEHFVKSWLRRKKNYLYNTDNIQCLTIMILHKSMGYEFDKIKKISQYEISKKKYTTYREKLRLTYNQIINVLPNRLGSSNTYLPEDEDADREADWYECNSVDHIDGNKYTGYLRREYEDSRFGSFPLHDDYSEESWD